VVLGLLQTPGYASEVLHLPGGPAETTAEDEIARMIAARLRRQAILYEPAREVTLLMGEAALRTQLADPGVMRDQLGHIARLAETVPRNVTIGIVPFARRWPLFTLTGWRLVNDLLTIEHPGGDLDIADPADVAAYWRYTRLLQEAAITGPAAAQLCRLAARDLPG
jgi:hypothetical protein